MHNFVSYIFSILFHTCILQANLSCHQLVPKNYLSKNYAKNCSNYEQTLIKSLPIRADKPVVVPKHPSPETKSGEYKKYPMAPALAAKSEAFKACLPGNKVAAELSDPCNFP